MSRKPPPEIVVEFLNQPPTTCDPAQIPYWATRIAELHMARMQAEGTAAQASPGQEGARSREEGDRPAVITSAKAAARQR